MKLMNVKGTYDYLPKDMKIRNMINFLKDSLNLKTASLNITLIVTLKLTTTF